jgi:hypothetical protein
MSIPGLDLTYIFLDDQDSNKDLAIVQEVKTTGSADLSYADNLTRDYQKLFEDDLDACQSPPSNREQTRVRTKYT